MLAYLMVFVLYGQQGAFGGTGLRLGQWHMGTILELVGLAVALQGY